MLVDLIQAPDRVLIGSLVLSLLWAALVPMPPPLTRTAWDRIRTAPGQRRDEEQVCQRKRRRALARWYSGGMALLVFVAAGSPRQGGGGSSYWRLSLWVASLWACRAAATLGSIGSHRMILRLRSRYELSSLVSLPSLDDTLASRTGGPLGLGASKAWDALFGVLWIHRSGLQLVGQGSGLADDDGRVEQHHYRHRYLTWGKGPHEQPAGVWLGMALLCLAVNGVLHWWSQFHQGRRHSRTSVQEKCSATKTTTTKATLQHDHHPGVAHVVRSTAGRRLEPTEHARLLLWAVANAVSEEVTSRGVWRICFEQLMLRGTGSTGSIVISMEKLNVFSNIFQAGVFGIWHYYGIPSGAVGVGLTFVYGLLMGGLSDYNDGLGLAIVAHSVADYYIFAAIARRQLFHNDEQQLKQQKQKDQSDNYDLLKETQVGPARKIPIVKPQMTLVLTFCKSIKL